MSYIVRAIPYDKWAFAEQRDILLSVTHTFTLNTYDLVGNGVLPAVFSSNIQDFTIDPTGRFTYTGVTTELFEVSVIIQGLQHNSGGATTYQGATYINGVVAPNSEILYTTTPTASDPVIYTYRHEVTLDPNDIVDFRIRNISRTETGAFRQYSVIVKSILNLL